LPLFRDGIADDLYDCGYAKAGIAYSFFMYKLCMNHTPTNLL